MGELEKLLKENNKLLKEQNKIMREYSDCRLADEPVEKFWQKWEFYYETIQVIALVGIFYTNAYSMNHVFVPNALANFLNYGIIPQGILPWTIVIILAISIIFGYLKWFRK
jgi:hypothetical protein